MKVLGIDEAGRGPVIGPLVMCGYMIESRNLPKLRELGVKDSKLLARRRREQLAEKLEKLSSDIAVLKIPAEEIDRLRISSNLNKLEIKLMCGMVDALQPDKVIIDALEANESGFMKKIAVGIRCKAEIIAENFADKNYPEVSAASIIAKTNRDRAVDELKKIFGDFGSGYTSDPRTVNFLKDWIKNNKDYPEIVRKSWVTAQVIREKKEQTSLAGFGRVPVRS